MPIGIGTSGLNVNQPFKLKQDDELLKESVYNILTTRKGERAGNPEFGTDIYNLLFNPNIKQYWDAIKLEIVNNIELFEPRVVVLNIEYITDIDNHKISLYIKFLSLLTQEVSDMAIMELTG